MNSEKHIPGKGTLIAAIIASMISVGLMLRACRFNDSGVALALIAVWILSPMIALGLAEIVAKRWLIFRRRTVHFLMLVVASGWVIVYGIDVFVPLSPRRGFPYALVPAVSWLVLVTVLVVEAVRTQTRPKKRLA